ncbi:hypothetical protein [Capnocytophaga cynodegmi]|uniref:hypothetical protein n=1 Tax=Capnocytophaga cynodegmi TaxID=28189 RepID=UPI001BB42EDC|nr:hypothetical protein [Capnocytophaga cynodegmi]
MGIHIKTSTIEEQIFIGELLTRMQIPFREDNEPILSKAALLSVEKGIEDAEKGNFETSENVHKSAKKIIEEWKSTH